MPLDPEVQAFLQAQAAAAAEAGGVPPISEQTVEQARQGYQALVQALGPGVELYNVEGRTFPGPGGDVPLRIYRPSEEPNLPILVYYHGGGWVIGDLDTHDHVCRQLAQDVECLVVSVDYRLAPEHPFPAAPDDACAALDWVSHNAEEIGGDPSRIAVGGDSAGGNLAAVAALHARDRQIPLRLQMLIYPAVDMRQQHASIEENQNGPVLTRDHMTWFRGHYIADDAQTSDPRASPMLAERHHDLAPAVIVTAEFDPLRDEGNEYAQVLLRSGVEVTARCFAGQIHVFFQLSPLLSGAREAVSLTVRSLRQAFAG